MITFKQALEVEEGTVLVVDSFNLAFRYKHKQVLDFKEDYIKTIQSLKKSYKAEKVIILCDKGASTYRTSIYPEYKANRLERREQQTEQEDEYFKAFFKEYLAILDELRNMYPVLRFDGVEADDIAAYIVCNKDKFNYNKIWLISSDKDWDLLVQDNVSRFSYVTRKEVTVENWAETHNYSINDFISVKCLTGDTGDNIPGIPKVGPKTAEKLIALYGSAMDIVAELPLPGKYVYIENLNILGEEYILRNYKLMDLIAFHEDAIGKENIESINNELQY